MMIKVVHGLSDAWLKLYEHPLGRGAIWGLTTMVWAVVFWFASTS